ncbi:RNA polymerase subunit sigma, partial [Paenibacillus riograndensis]
MQSESMYHVLTKMMEGDQQAFHTLYDATYKDVYRTVSFLVDHPQEREDIMNEIYMQMWTSLPNYDPNRPFHFLLPGLAIRQVQRFRTQSWRSFRIFERNRALSREKQHLHHATLGTGWTGAQIRKAVPKVAEIHR